MDESGVNLAMLRSHGRSLKGERVRGSKPQLIGRNVSLIGALSLNKVVAGDLWSCKWHNFVVAFIVRDLVPKLGQNACVVMDNARIHQGEMVR